MGVCLLDKSWKTSKMQKSNFTETNLTMEMETFQEFSAPDTLHIVLDFEDLEPDSMGRPRRC